MIRLLIVEDNEMNRDMLARRLMRRGYEVYTAVNGREGVDIACSQRPDLILMDLSLPVMDGWEATRRIRADARTADLPVIALTAHALPSDHAEALHAGCNDVDTKPVDLDRLVGKIEAQLTHARNGTPKTHSGA
ncbi:MAG TPA: response regulator [Gammaproteobacteria bacterium]